MRFSCARSRTYKKTDADEEESNAAEAAMEDPVVCVPETGPEAAEVAQCAGGAMDVDMEDDGSEDEDEDATVLIPCSMCMKRGQSVIECCKCLRGFHIHGEDGCNPLRVSPEEGRSILSLQDFQCPNCTSHQHHCHMCKREGSCTEGNENLFMCLLSNCTLLHCSDCQRGECQSTICPMHVCSACGAISSRDQPLIECRHCSTSYHEACLPETLKSNGSTRISLDDLRMVCTRHNSEEATEVQLFAEDVLELWRQSMARKLPDVFKAQLPTKETHRKRKRVTGTARSAVRSTVNTPHDDRSADKISDVVAEEPISGEPMHVDTSPAGPNTPENESRAKKYKTPVSYKRTRGKVVCDKIVCGRRQNVEDPVSKLAEDGDQSDEDDFSDDIIFGCGGARQKICAVFAEAVQKHRDIKKRIKIYYPHDNQPPRPVPWAKLHKLETLNKAWSENKISEEVYRRDILEYVRLRQTIDRYLGPLCHGDRYTSFGRHFTKPEIMDRVVERVMEHIADGDIVVDMTCGANTFVPAIKKKAKENGGKVSGKAFDVILPFNSEDWERNSWFNVEPRDLCNGTEGGSNIDHIVVGINPPFGMNGNLAGKFVQKSADLQVRMMFLIVPPKTQNPHGYSVVHLDPDLCQKRSSRGGHQEKGAAFYLPSNNQESWSAVTPEFRILKRVDPEVHAHLRFLGQPSRSKASMVSSAPIMEVSASALLPRPDIKRISFLQNQENQRDFKLHGLVPKGEPCKTSKLMIPQTDPEVLLPRVPLSYPLVDKKVINHRHTSSALTSRFMSSISQIQGTEESHLGGSRGLLPPPSKPFQVSSHAEQEMKNTPVIQPRHITLPMDRVKTQISLNPGVWTQRKDERGSAVNDPPPAVEIRSRSTDGCGTIGLPSGVTVRRINSFGDACHPIPPPLLPLPLLPPPPPPPRPLPPPPPPRPSPPQCCPSLPHQPPLHAQERNVKYLTVDLKTLQVAQTQIMSTAESHQVTNFPSVQQRQAQATSHPVTLDSLNPPFCTPHPSGPSHNVQNTMGAPCAGMAPNLGNAIHGREHCMKTVQLDRRNWSSDQPGAFPRQAICPMREIRTTEVIEYRNRNESSHGCPLQGSGNLL